LDSFRNGAFVAFERAGAGELRDEVLDQLLEGRRRFRAEIGVVSH
jgi:hypothetical protein